MPRLIAARRAAGTLLRRFEVDRLEELVDLCLQAPPDSAERREAIASAATSPEALAEIDQAIAGQLRTAACAELRAVIDRRRAAGTLVREPRPR